MQRRFPAMRLKAAEISGVPLVALRRSAWQRQHGDRWIEVASVADAVNALGDVPRKVFLTLGRQELLPFEAAPRHHYLIRSVDPVEPPLSVPNAVYLTARGPFEQADEARLLQDHGIEAIVAKNSGGPASYGKIAAARELGIDVVLIRRPDLPDVPCVETVEEMLAWLDHAPVAPEITRRIDDRALVLPLDHPRFRGADDHACRHVGHVACRLSQAARSG
jgi:precorrin-6A/cobalt-precorrin-6A reductase